MSEQHKYLVWVSTIEDRDRNAEDPTHPVHRYLGVVQAESQDAALDEIAAVHAVAGVMAEYDGELPGEPDVLPGYVQAVRQRVAPPFAVEEGEFP